MSLYDGIDNKEVGADTKSDVVSGWSSGYKLLQSQLQAKKASLMQVKRQKQQTTIAPVVDLKRHADISDQPLHFNQQTGRNREPHDVYSLERGPPASLGSSPFIASEPVPSLTGVADEYDPLRPNDYEELVKKRREQKLKEREEERKNSERESRRKHDRGDKDDYVPKEMDRPRRHRDEEEEEMYEKPKRSAPGGAAIAPPKSLIEEDSSSTDALEDIVIPPVERLKTSTSGFNTGVGSPSDIGSTNCGSIASKIMAKYGYKEGQGLGKQEQGMSTALFVEKTSKRGGKIIHEKDLPKEPQSLFSEPLNEPPRDQATTNANLLKNPSKVILLRNMVGPGEVDEDLEPETAEECTKYGKVVKVLIFEKRPGVARNDWKNLYLEIPGGLDEEAVRIFIEFERVEAAIKAVVDLNGRYFGGRVVKACFYNLDKFRRLDLAEEFE